MSDEYDDAAYTEADLVTAATLARLEAERAGVRTLLAFAAAEGLSAASVLKALSGTAAAPNDPPVGDDGGAKFDPNKEWDEESPDWFSKAFDLHHDATDAERLAAAVEVALAALEDGSDPEEALDRLHEHGTFEKGHWDATVHPRGDDGRFIKKDDIQAAKSDPKKAKELKKRVKDPEERKKLDKLLADPNPIGTKRGLAKHESETKRAEKVANRAKAREIRIRLIDQDSRGEELNPDDLRALIPHLSQMSHEELSHTRTLLARQGASFGGKRLRADRVAALVAWATGKAEPKPEAESGTAAAQPAPTGTSAGAKVERPRDRLGRLRSMIPHAGIGGGFSPQKGDTVATIGDEVAAGKYSVVGASRDGMKFTIRPDRATLTDDQRKLLRSDPAKYDKTVSAFEVIPPSHGSIARRLAGIVGDADTNQSGANLVLDAAERDLAVIPSQSAPVPQVPPKPAPVPREVKTNYTPEQISTQAEAFKRHTADGQTGLPGRRDVALAVMNQFRNTATAKELKEFARVVGVSDDGTRDQIGQRLVAYALDDPKPNAPAPQPESGGSAAPVKTRLQALAEKAHAQGTPNDDPNTEYEKPRDQYNAFVRAVVPPTGTKPDSAKVLDYLATLPDHARERLDQHFRSGGKSLREIEQFHRLAAGQTTPEQVRAERAARADAGDAARAAMTGSGAGAAPALAALKKNPMADAEHLTAAAQAAPASAKRFLETAAANLHDQHDDEKQSRSHTLRRLASSYAEAERMDPAAAEHVAGVMAQYGVSREHKPGDVVPFDGARHQSGAAVSTGAAVRVTAPALTATSPDGRPYLLRPAQVEPVATGTGAAAPAAGGGGAEPPKVPPVASGAGDGDAAHPLGHFENIGGPQSAAPGAVFHPLRRGDSPKTGTATVQYGDKKNYIARVNGLSERYGLDRQFIPEDSGVKDNSGAVKHTIPPLGGMYEISQNGEKHVRVYYPARKNGEVVALYSTSTPEQAKQALAALASAGVPNYHLMHAAAYAAGKKMNIADAVKQYLAAKDAAGTKFDVTAMPVVREPDHAAIARSHGHEAKGPPRKRKNEIGFMSGAEAREAAAEFRPGVVVQVDGKPHVITTRGEASYLSREDQEDGASGTPGWTVRYTVVPIDGGAGTAAGTALPAASGGGSEPPKVPPVASGAGDGERDDAPLPRNKSA